MRKQEGFTLIELLVVIAIIGLVASIVLVSVNSARNKSRIAKAQSDLHQIRNALSLLGMDTNMWPDKTNYDLCTKDQEEWLNACSSGVQCTDGGFPGWSGPYMSVVPTDPWGNNYIFDSDYYCSHANPLGCEGTNEIVSVVHSGGPNGSVLNVYDDDNIVLILCGN